VDYHFSGVIDDCNVWIHGPDSCFTHTFLKKTPTIIWNNPADITYGTALNSNQLNADSPDPGIFIYTPEEGTILSSGTHTLHVDFIPDDVTYNTTSKDVTINVLNQTHVPEFPSVALPMVAVLGLVAIVGRKKE